MESSSCNLCENPYPFMCSECYQTIEEETKIQQEEIEFKKKIYETKKFIGSGEDVNLEMLI